MKWTVSEMLRLACIHAESDRRDFAECNPKGSPEQIEADALADALYKYRLKRWGRTTHERVMDEADVIDAKTGAIVRKGKPTEAHEKP